MTWTLSLCSSLMSGSSDDTDHAPGRLPASSMQGHRTKQHSKLESVLRSAGMPQHGSHHAETTISYKCAQTTTCQGIIKAHSRSPRRALYGCVTPARRDMPAQTHCVHGKYRCVTHTGTCMCLVPTCGTMCAHVELCAVLAAWADVSS